MIPETQCGLSLEVQKKLVRVFNRFAGIEKVLLYGSRAKGTFKHGSDIDLTIVAPGMDLITLAKVEDDLDELLLPHKIDLSLFHHINSPSLVAHIQQFGIELKA
jgi:predicted nucleotidyltransferase